MVGGMYFKHIKRSSADDAPVTRSLQDSHQGISKAFVEVSYMGCSQNYGPFWL